MSDVLSPVQAELGRRPGPQEDLRIADERAASAAIEDLLVRLGRRPPRAPHGPTVVVASAEHDAHALGGRVVATRSPSTATA